MIQLTVQQAYGVTPADLARALWEASPEDFAQVFDQLDDLMRSTEGASREDGRHCGRDRLDDFARGLGAYGCFARGREGLRFLSHLACRAQFFLELRAHEKQKAAAERPSPNP